MSPSRPPEPPAPEQGESERTAASLAAAALDNFHRALGDEPGRGNARLRITLHQEEHDELIGALEECEGGESVGGPAPRSRMELARELADVVYLAYGTAHAFAIDLDAAVMEVHRAAMSKLFPPNGAERVVREDGKILKPPGFIPPNMESALLPAQSPEGRETR